MKVSIQIIVVALLAALIAATLYDCQPVPAANVNSGNKYSALNASPSAENAAHTITVTVMTTVSVPVSSIPTMSISEAGPAEQGNHMIIAITNSYGRYLSISFASNVGGPSPVGNHSPTTLSDNAFTQVSFPTGWAGRINVGPNLNPYGSKIEASYTGPPDVDVSYVDVYLVPITCSSEGIAVAGCNIDLFKQPGCPCEDPVDGPVCLNPTQNVPDGPAAPFFAACARAAYTFPKDDGANVSNLGSKFVSCCVGTTCKAPSMQGMRGIASNHKRMRVKKTQRRLLKGNDSPLLLLPLVPRMGHRHKRRSSA